jgi:hypothetical protein
VSKPTLPSPVVESRASDPVVPSPTLESLTNATSGKLHAAASDETHKLTIPTRRRAAEDRRGRIV